MINVAILLLVCCHVRAQTSDGAKERNRDPYARNQYEKLTNITTKAKEALFFFQMLPELVKMDNPSLDVTKEQIYGVSNHLQQVGKVVSLVEHYLSREEDKTSTFIAQSFIGDDAQFYAKDVTLHNVYYQMRNISFFQRLNEAADALYLAFSKFDTFMNGTSKPESRKDFVEMCNSRQNPRSCMTKINAFIGSKHSKRLTIENLLESSGYDFKELKMIFAVILHDFAGAALLQQACLGMLREGNNLQRKYARSSQAQMESIVAVFEESVAQLIRNGLKKRFIKDMNQMFEVTYMDTNFRLCWNLTMFLNTKYFWLDWNVMVFNDAEGKFFGKTNERYWNYVNSNGVKVVVTWSNKRDYDFKRDLLFQLAVYLEHKTCMEKCFKSNDQYMEFRKLYNVSRFLVLPRTADLYYSLSENAQHRHYSDCDVQIVVLVK